MTVITSSVYLAVDIVKSRFSKRLRTYPVQSDKYLWRHIWEVLPKEWTTALLWFCELKVFDIWYREVSAALLFSITSILGLQLFPEKSGFSLRIVVVGERCNVRYRSIFWKRLHVWIKKIVIGYRTFAGEFCVVNGEFSDLRCLMNTALKNLRQFRGLL